jgi:chlorobactene glucosyltransferase
MMGKDSLLVPETLIIAFLFAMLVIAAINMRITRNLSDCKKISRYPRISVLVPARNEEDKLGPCVKSLLAQNYPDFQVIVLNDSSTDGTGPILESLAAGDSRLKIIQGKHLPPDWLGKHWACHQLYREADGDVLIFTDADTIHMPDTLLCTAAALEEEKADMLSIIPRHILGTWPEKLVMPYFALGVFAIVPLPPRLRPEKTYLSSSGKLLAFSRRAYEACGGFEAIRMNVLDDLELPQRVISCGLRYRVFDGTNNVSTRMYHSFKEVYEGLTKNMFASYDYNIPLFIATWLWILFVFWQPIIALTSFKIPDYPPTLSMGLTVIAIVASLSLWAVYYQRFKFPVYMVIFYPLSAALMAVISFSSMVLTLSGRATWKDRKLPTRKIY